MRNLKKVLALVLVMALSLSLIVMTVAAFNDVKVTDSDAPAINLLNSLKILQGKENNNFDPDGTIKRSEFAAVVYRLMTGNENANRYNGATKFSDVPANHWASGYVNWATNNNIIGGYPDGTFKPDNNVTMAEAAKMLVVALGYSQTKANGQPLDFPYDYIDLAERKTINLFKNVADFSADDAAVRHVVSRMGYNALFSDCYYNAAKDGNGNLIKYTLAEGTFNIKKVSGTIVDSSNAVTGVGTLTEEGQTRVILEEKDSDGHDTTRSVTVECDTGVDMLFQKVDMWYVDNNDNGSYDSGDDVANFTINDGASLQLAGGGTFTDKAEGKETYKVNGTTYDVNLGSETKLMIFNAVASNSYNATASRSDVMTAVEGATKQDYVVTFIDNNNDDVYESVIAVEYKKGKITSVNNTASKIVFGAGSVDMKNVSIYSNYAKDDIVYFNRLSTFVEKDSVNKYTVEKANIIENVVFKGFGSDANSYVLGDTTYVANAAIAALTNNDFNKEFNLTFNHNGYLVDAERVSESTETKYVYVTDVATKTNNWDEITGGTLTGTLADGTSKTFDVKFPDSNLDDDEKLGTAGKFIWSNEDGWTIADGSDAGTKGTTYAMNKVFEYTVNSSGVITNLKEIDHADGVTASAVPAAAIEYKKNNNTLYTGPSDTVLGHVNDDTVVFIKNTKDDTVKVYKGSDMPSFESTVTVAGQQAVKNAASGISYVKVMYFTVADSITTSSDTNTKYGYLVSASYGAGTETDTYAVNMKIVVDGETTNFVTANYDDSAAAEAVKDLAGSFIKFEVQKSDNKIKADTAANMTVGEHSADSVAAADNYGLGSYQGWLGNTIVFYTANTFDADAKTVKVGSSVSARVSEDVKYYLVTGDPTDRKSFVETTADSLMSADIGDDASNTAPLFEYIVASTTEGNEAASPKIVAVFIYTDVIPDVVS